MKKGNSGKAAGSKKPNGVDTRKDRRSNTGMVGSPKKGGHGGKFTWEGDGIGGYSTLDLGLAGGAMDAKDPNFEEKEEPQIAVAPTM